MPLFLRKNDPHALAVAMTTVKMGDQLAEIGAHGNDPEALDAYLDQLVPGITARATGAPQGAS